MTSHTLLTEQHRTTIGQLHRQRDHRHHRCRHHQHHPGDHQIQRPLHEQLHVRRVRRLQVVQRLIRHRRRPQPPMTHPVQPVRHLDVHALLLERLDERGEVAGGQGADHHDHPADVELADVLEEACMGTEVDRRQAVHRGDRGVPHHAAHAEARLRVLAQHRHQIGGIGVGAHDDHVAEVMTGGAGGTEPRPVAAAEPQQQEHHEHRADDQPAQFDLHAHRGEQHGLDHAEHHRRTHDATDLLRPARRHTGEVEALRVQHRETGRDQHRMDHEEPPDRRALAELPHLHRRPRDRQRHRVDPDQPASEVADFEALGTTGHARLTPAGFSGSAWGAWRA
ncbi:unannotated protein [freshwater metagenome]|uniref:Unannotated protein n=1 Tax=freshwater metagenome TaxID=449393 RepID=A0A6J6FC25_9ZZZZ